MPAIADARGGSLGGAKAHGVHLSCPSESLQVDSTRPGEPGLAGDLSSPLLRWLLALLQNTLKPRTLLGGHGDAAGRSFVLGRLPARAPAQTAQTLSRSEGESGDMPVPVAVQEQPAPKRGGEQGQVKPRQVLEFFLDGLPRLCEPEALLLRTFIAGGSCVRLTAAEARGWSGLSKLRTFPFWIA